MVIDSVELFERVIRKVAKETGHTFAEVMDAIEADEEYFVPPEVFDEVYKRLFS